MNRPTHVVITGANRGIGAALAKAYSEKGVRLSLLGRKLSELEIIAKACRELKADVSIYVIDVTQTELLQKTISDIDAEKPVDLVIANAGTTNYLAANGHLESWIDIKTVFDVNVIGALATLSPLIPKMSQRKQGQIALISSMSAFYGLPVCPAYSASKSAIKTYGEALRGLLSKEKIKVSVIFPGFVRSNMSDQFLCKKPFLMTPDKAAQIIKSGLKKNKARITFPFLLGIGMKLLSILPCFLSDFILLTLGYSVTRK